MSGLYTLNGSYPAPLPFRVKMPDGSTRTSEAVLDVAEELGFVLVDPPPAVPVGKVLTWDGSDWGLADAPPPPVPQTVSQAQLRIALHRAGLLPAVEAAVAAAAVNDLEVAIRWNAPTMERSNPILNSMADALGITEAQRDNLFRLAGSV